MVKEQVQPKPRINPFVPDAGVLPPFLAGRTEEIETFDKLLNGERSMVLYGLRGVGKTVLLQRFRTVAPMNGWTVSPISRQEVNEKTNILVHMGQVGKAFLDEFSYTAKTKRGFQKLVDALYQVEIAVPPFKVTLQRPAGAGEETLDQKMIDLMLGIGHAAKNADGGALLMFDEIHRLQPEQVRALVSGLNIARQDDNLPIRFVGAGLPAVGAQWRDAAPYAERMFRRLEVDKLSAKESAEALQNPARDNGGAFTDDALTFIVEKSGRYPFFIQTWGYVLWDLATSFPVTLEDARRAESEVQAVLDKEFFLPRLQGATPAEHKVLVVMASLGDGPYRLHDIAIRAYPKEGRIPNRLIEGLRDAHLIYSTSFGHWDFTVPNFADFLQRSEQ